MIGTAFALDDASYAMMTVMKVKSVIKEGIGQSKKTSGGDVHIISYHRPGAKKGQNRRTDGKGHYWPI